MKHQRQDVYQRITDQIVDALERGPAPWVRPWNAEHMAGHINRPLRHNEEPYSGINVIVLWTSANTQGFNSPIWMTYRQAQALEGQVRTGSRGTPVVYANKFVKKEKDENTGEEVERTIPFLKGYTVFNVEQIEGLPESYYSVKSSTTTPLERSERAESFFSDTGAAVSHGGNRAFYMPGQDRVQMPPFESFRDSLSYYAILAHEVTHWTGDESRLDRNIRNRFGTEAYAVEELIAELGASFLCSDLELALEPREDHASYIHNWIQVLKNDKKAIFTASAHAQRAADYINETVKKKREAIAA